MADNSREIVLDMLLEMERNKTFSHKLVKAVLDKYDYLEGQEKRFIKRLTEGCIERRLELDYVIGQFSTVPVNKMKPLIRCLMRMGTYQILYMDSVPDSAACNEAVKIAGKRKFTNLKGFVNGVLRKISGSKESIPMPDKGKEPLYYMSIKYSMPMWIVEQFAQDYGVEGAERILGGLMEIHPVSIRFSRGLAEAERERLIESWKKQGVNVEKSEEVPGAYFLSGVDGLGSLKGFSEGAFTVQDVSSMQAVQVAGIKEGDFVMDICAAPGGKTMLAAELAGRVLSRDVSYEKVAMIEENLQRMGLEDKVETQVHDATVHDETMVEKADVVLMDVPCSGLGVMGKKRDIKYNITPQSMESLQVLQKNIVDNSWQYVKKGGVLLYSTCTIHRGENEEMVKYICENYPFVVEEQKQILPGFAQADGFFYARLRRQ